MCGGGWGRLFGEGFSGPRQDTVLGLEKRCSLAVAAAIKKYHHILNTTSMVVGKVVFMIPATAVVRKILLAYTKVLSIKMIVLCQPVAL